LREQLADHDDNRDHGNNCRGAFAEYEHLTVCEREPLVRT
jgi:hypothetical protein